MSDHDAAPDPIDEAYVQAEALLSDDEARTARRTRVLAAVAHEGATPAASSTATQRPAWGRGRWLAAASVAGLGVLIATQIYTPPHQAPSAPTAPAAPIPAPRGIAAAPPPPVAARSEVPLPRAVAAGPRPAAPIYPQTIWRPAPPTPPAEIAPAPQAFPAAPPPPPPPPSPEVVTAERRASDQAVEAQSVAPRAKVPVAVSAFTGQSRDVQPPPEALAGAPSDQGASLRAAAAAGRTTEVQALLAGGVAVDVPDADGNTALMQSIQADHPAVAAVLRRHGASLDRRNDAGESARDMAAAKGDAALDQALGVDP